MKRVIGKLLLSGLLVLLWLGCVGERRNVDLREAPRLGQEEAPIEIIVYSDFQCAFCKRAAAELKRIHRERPARVKVYYKHYPLSYHPQALNAAIAAEAARMQGKFWEMHDLLFAYADQLHDTIYPELAQQVDLDLEQFDGDFQSFETRNRVLADRAEGDAIGVDYTPYFLIDGVQYRGSYANLAARLSRQEQQH